MKIVNTNEENRHDFRTTIEIRKKHLEKVSLIIILKLTKT